MASILDTCEQSRGDQPSGGIHATHLYPVLWEGGETMKQVRTVNLCDKGVSMKKTILVVALALVLTFAFASSAFATTGKFFKGGVDYYTWTNPTGSPAPGTAWIASGVSTVGSNTVSPGVHANYSATTAKCGICHSVHRANGAGSKLLPVADATCAGCHAGGTAITAKMITVGVVNMNWRAGDPVSSAFSYGGAGPHNDALDTLYGDAEWDGISTPPAPSLSLIHISEPTRL